MTINIFGSSLNGFGSNSSDLDMSLTFEGHIEHTMKCDILKWIAEELRAKPYKYLSVLAVTSARVPVVKFKLIHGARLMDCDISVNNNLGLRNTTLLRMYCSLDRRVCVLGHALKKFAKVCDMADAPSGSLSSYAYILMLLHYLQRTMPPVIPVLQELRKPGTSHQIVNVDGWDCYFFEESDRNKVAAVWADYGRNQDSIGKLWFDLLRYYAHEFDWENHVVTIKQSEVLTKREKWWSSKQMCIEVREYILQRFEKALWYHSTYELVDRIIMNREQGSPMTEMDLVMDPSYLIGQDKAPKIMVCNTCGLRGHKECGL